MAQRHTIVEETVSDAPAQPVQPARRVVPAEPVVPVEPAVPAEPVVAAVPARHYAVLRVTRVIWFLFGLLEALIGLRVVLKLIAANPDAGLSRFVYAVTAPFLAPFQGLTATPSAGGMVLEIGSLVAILVYGLIAWGLVRLAWILFDRPAPYA